VYPKKEQRDRNAKAGTYPQLFTPFTKRKNPKGLQRTLKGAKKKEKILRLLL
jgi:hypothetical protein